MVKLRQTRDTRITGSVNQAFSEVTLGFFGVDGEHHEVVLDMESGLDVIYQLDGGHDEVRRIQAQRRKSSSGPDTHWLRRLLRI